MEGKESRGRSGGERVEGKQWRGGCLGECQGEGVEGKE